MTTSKWDMLDHQSGDEATADEESVRKEEAEDLDGQYVSVFARFHKFQEVDRFVVFINKDTRHVHLIESLKVIVLCKSIY